MIEIKNLLFQYKKKKPLFDDFSLQLNSGSIVGLLGKNGAGKTSLLYLMAGLLSPEKGNLSVNGFPPFKRHPDFLADLCLVPEEFALPSISIDRYVKANSPLYPSFDSVKFDKILTEFELERSNRLHQLSHGQRKKFLIAFTLASNCKILILDEPTNGLDIPSKSQFRKILVGSITDEQLVIISTHQVKDIDNIIDQVVVVDSGKLLFNNSIEHINQQWSFESVPNLTGITEVLYQESSISGYKVVRPVKDGIESPLDLELLFNAITSKSIKNEKP
jgi:ABC-2 type transport system ATP-binding protein